MDPGHLELFSRAMRHYEAQVKDLREQRYIMMQEFSLGPNVEDTIKNLEVSHDLLAVLIEEICALCSKAEDLYLGCQILVEEARLNIARGAVDSAGEHVLNKFDECLTHHIALANTVFEHVQDIMEKAEEARMKFLALESEALDRVPEVFRAVHTVVGQLIGHINELDHPRNLPMLARILERLRGVAAIMISRGLYERVPLARASRTSTSTSQK